MKTKTFEIRFAPEEREADEHALNDFLSRVRVVHVKSCVLHDRDAWAVFVLYMDPEPPSDATIPAEPLSGSLSPDERRRYQALCRWRNGRAAATGYKPFVIATDRDLLNVAKSGARNPDDLLELHGFGPRKMELYGEEIVALLESV